MRLFTCGSCDGVLYFENALCLKCGAAVGFDAASGGMVALTPADEAGGYTSAPASEDAGGKWRYCANAAHAACNWILAADDPHDFCFNCRHNDVVPDLENPDQVVLWRRVEIAKHRLFYSLLRLKLPTGADDDGAVPALRFDVLADDPDPAAPKIMTGHSAGRIILALVEADDAEREQRRLTLHEPYRTLLGHLRHEVGHYYWDVLVKDSAALAPFRALFGDETADYDAALARHYANGAAPDWAEHHVSVYAGSHPWEDFAETFAHYLHITDTLEMAVNFGVRLQPRIDSPDRAALAAAAVRDPVETRNFDAILRQWLPITYMANNLNRCMGISDAYPFVLAPPVCEKLQFIHELVSPYA
jgi:hypothetical protein